jgi:hypothetical protein
MSKLSMRGALPPRLVCVFTASFKQLARNICAMKIGCRRVYEIIMWSNGPGIVQLGYSVHNQ